MNVSRACRLICWLCALGAIVADQAAAAPRPVWSWSLPQRQPAWEFNRDMPRDEKYQPIVHEKLVLIGCEHNGALLAIDLETGAERWRFYTDGPIRMPPTADAERIAVASDDGHLYVSTTRASCCGSSAAARRSGRCWRTDG